MPKRARLFFAIFLFFLACTREPAPLVFFVSPHGNDAWSGRLASAHADKSDGPFATLERAKLAMRTHKDRPVDIELAGGVYSLQHSLNLDSLDSRTGTCPAVWRPAEQAKVQWVGAHVVASWSSVHSADILQQLPQEARPHILEIDLEAEGIAAIPEMTMRGGPPLELFCNDQRMTMARYPNDGWLLIADVPQSGAKRYNEGLDREKRFKGVPVGRHYGRITVDQDRPLTWRNEPQIYLHGYWTWDWSDSYQKVQSIDRPRKEIIIAEPHHNYGYTTGQRFYFLNVLEELDQPGEWVLDRQHHKIYFWPTAPVANGDVKISTLSEPLLKLNNADYITFAGIDFCQTVGQGVVIAGGQHDVLAGCRLYQIGQDAVTVDGGREHSVASCDIFDVSVAGIVLFGGDRKTLTPSAHSATNNHIHHYSQWIRSGKYALFIDGVGQHVAHNLVHDAPHEAVYVRGNDHVIEYNEFHDICQETGDAGALHTGRNWTWQGNVIRYNYWHHLKGPGLHGVAAVYLDDWGSGFHVYGNLFYRAGRATLIGGGRNNIVENNVYIECQPSLHLDARGLGWAQYYFNGTYPTLFQTFAEMHADQPPYSTKYPALKNLLQDDPAMPRHNRLERNISSGGRWLDIYDYNVWKPEWVVIKDNVVSDTIVVRRRDPHLPGWDPYYLNIDWVQGFEHLSLQDQRILNEFPGNSFQVEAAATFDAQTRKLTIHRPPAGFKPLPVEEMGLQPDHWRNAKLDHFARKTARNTTM
jgi:hypothetical protein